MDSRRNNVKRPAFWIPVWILSVAAGPSPLERLPHDAAGKIVRQAIEQAGGWEAWASKKNVQIRVSVRELKPDGAIASTRVETHRYRLQPELGVRIESDQAAGVLWVNNSRFASKVANAAEDFSPAAGLEARNRTFRAEYDFGMPFKLADRGTHLESLGKGPFGPEQQAERVRVTYDPGVGDAGGQHTWTYFFDARTGAWLGTHVDYGSSRGSGRFEVTELSESRSFDGLRLATRRVCLPADANGKTGPAFSETVYEDVQFNVAMDEGLFAIPPK